MKILKGSLRAKFTTASIAISVSIHMLLIFGSSFKSIKRFNQTQLTIVPLKLDLTQGLNKMKAQRKDETRKVTKSRNKEGKYTQFNKSSPHTNEARALRYRDLFPKDHTLMVTRENDMADDSLHKIASRSADPENDGFSEDMRNRNYSELSAFARDLAQRIFVPLPLVEIHPRGTAFARFSRTRNADTWNIKELTGNPYGRALLFEALNGVQAKSLGLIKLNQSEFSTLRVELSFVAKRVTKLTLPSPSVHIMGNVISIEVTKEFIDKEWIIVGPGYLNLLGVGLYVADKLTHDPSVDPELMRLRQSPAFKREQ